MSTELDAGVPGSNLFRVFFSSFFINIVDKLVYQVFNCMFSGALHLNLILPRHIISTWQSLRVSILRQNMAIGTKNAAT